VLKDARLHRCIISSKIVEISVNSTTSYAHDIIDVKMYRFCCKQALISNVWCISCENIEDDIMYLNIGNLEDLQKKRLFIIVSNVQYFGIILIINTSFNVSFNFNSWPLAVKIFYLSNTQNNVILKLTSYYWKIMLIMTHIQVFLEMYFYCIFCCYFFYVEQLLCIKIKRNNAENGA
jgi:hypothetical protein